MRYIVMQEREKGMEGGLQWGARGGALFFFFTLPQSRRHFFPFAPGASSLVTSLLLFPVNSR